MATYQLGFAGTPNNSFYGNNTYATNAVAGVDVVAPASGPCTKIFVWKDTAFDDVVVEVGLYDDDGLGEAENLLASATKSTGWSAGWNEVTVASMSITSGNKYHPAVVMASGSGTIGYDTSAGNTCDRDAGETALKDPWVPGAEQAYCFAVYAEYDDAGGSVSPNNLILSAIILEQTKAILNITADDLILSSTILESPIVSAVVSPDNLILSAIILEQAAIGGTVSPDDLILSSIILESPEVSGIISPDNLVLSAIILEQTKQSGEIAGPISTSISLSRSNILMNLSKPDISIALKKSNISMELNT